MNKGATMPQAVALALLVGATLSARQSPQDQQGETASFEVASVKPNKSGISNAVPRASGNGSYSASNVALKSVIANAYEVRIFQIEGDPAWVTSERFDIIARGREGTPDRLRPAMLRSLLAERFKLAAHFEMKEQPVYALVLARSDGRLGPRLKPAAPDAQPGLPFPSAGNGIGRMAGQAVLIDDFAGALAFEFRQMVINRTGLKGRFELDLQFTAGPSPAPEFPSVFTAVQEQLGLKLQAERAPVRVLVIDSVQRPTPD